MYNSKINWYMKYLKFWENFKYPNSKYIELSQILQSEIFDDYNIKSKTYENLDEYLSHKFWAFRVKNVGQSNCPLIANLKEIQDNKLEIEYINAFGVPENEKDEIIEKIQNISGLVEDFIGMKLEVNGEYWAENLYDIIIEFNLKENKE